MHINVWVSAASVFLTFPAATLFNILIASSPPPLSCCMGRNCDTLSRLKDGEGDAVAGRSARLVGPRHKSSISRKWVCAKHSGSAGRSTEVA